MFVSGESALEKCVSEEMNSIRHKKNHDIRH